jgi:hypothetical protein
MLNLQILGKVVPFHMNQGKASGHKKSCEPYRGKARRSIPFKTLILQWVLVKFGNITAFSYINNVT